MLRHLHAMSILPLLRSRIPTASDELDQRVIIIIIIIISFISGTLLFQALGPYTLPVIDTAVGQWRTRLRACVKAKGGH